MTTRDIIALLIARGAMQNEPMGLTAEKIMTAITKNNINSAWEGAQLLHSTECGCMQCVARYRSVVFDLGTALQRAQTDGALKQQGIDKLQDEIQRLRKIVQLHIRDLPGEGGIRLHSIAEFEQDGETQPMLYFMIYPASSEQQLMLGITLHNWGELSGQVVHAILVMEQLQDREQENDNNKNRSN